MGKWWTSRFGGVLCFEQANILNDVRSAAAVSTAFDCVCPHIGWWTDAFIGPKTHSLGFVSYMRTSVEQIHMISSKISYMSFQLKSNPRCLQQTPRAWCFRKKKDRLLSHRLRSPNILNSHIKFFSWNPVFSRRNPCFYRCLSPSESLKMPFPFRQVDAKLVAEAQMRLGKAASPHPSVSLQGSWSMMLAFYGNILGYILVDWLLNGHSIEM